jgi:hypothetical protein
MEHDNGGGLLDLADAWDGLAKKHLRYYTYTVAFATALLSTEENYVGLIEVNRDIVDAALTDQAPLDWRSVHAKKYLWIDAARDHLIFWLLWRFLKLMWCEELKRYSLRFKLGVDINWLWFNNRGRVSEWIIWDRWTRVVKEWLLIRDTE